MEPKSGVTPWAMGARRKSRLTLARLYVCDCRVMKTSSIGGVPVIGAKVDDTRQQSVSKSYAMLDAFCVHAMDL